MRDISRPGPLLSEGRTSLVHRWGRDSVVKLLKSSFDPRDLEVEAANALACLEAGAPAPGVRGVVEVDGTRGIVFERIHGPAMSDELAVDAGRDAAHAALLAQLHRDVVRLKASELVDVKRKLATKIERASALSAVRRSALQDLLSDLPSGHQVLHGDFHPGNVLLASPSPVVIDWHDAARGVPAADVARTAILLSPTSLSAENRTDPGVVQRVERFRDRYLSDMFRLGAVSRPDVEAWSPVVMAGRLSEGLDTAAEASLVGLIHAGLERIRPLR